MMSAMDLAILYLICWASLIAIVNNFIYLLTIQQNTEWILQIILSLLYQDKTVNELLSLFKELFNNNIRMIQADR